MNCEEAFCSKHPGGTTDPCRACGRARLRLAQERGGSDEDQRAVVVDEEGRGAAVGEVDGHRTGLPALTNSAKLVLDVRGPHLVGLSRVEIKLGSVVVELHWHEAEPSGVAS